MKNRFIQCLSAGALAAAAATAMADNTINIQGGGDSQINIDASAANNSLIDIYQVGTGLANKAGTVSPISQAGGNHTARIGQGATFAGGVWTPGTPVSNNSATISQSGAASDTASIFQATSSNTAAITQSGGSKTATVTQSGSTFNSAALTQNGAAALQASIIQNGAAASTLIATQAAASAYTLAVTQDGSGGHNAAIETTSGYNGSGITVNQSGSANTADVSGMSGGGASITQSNSSNTATVTGMSGGSASINQSGTGGNVSLVDQSSGALTISQQGANRGLTITNYGAGASSGQPLSVTQTTLILVPVTTYNPLFPPSGPTYSAQ